VITKINKDDTVRLKSRGPKMIVDKFVWNMIDPKEDEDRVECLWFQDKTIFNREIFKISSLL